MYVVRFNLKQSGSVVFHYSDPAAAKQAAKVLSNAMQVGRKTPAEALCYVTDNANREGWFDGADINGVVLAELETEVAANTQAAVMTQTVERATAPAMFQPPVLAAQREYPPDEIPSRPRRVGGFAA